MAGITLAQLAQDTQDPLTKMIALKILRESRMMSILPFENVSSLTVQAQWWESLPTGGYWRSLNEGFTSSEDGQLGEGQEALFGFGTDLTFDKIMQMVKNVVKDPVQLQIEGKLKSMTLDWNYAFVHGDPAVEPKQFTGIKKRVAALPTRQTVYFAASNAAPLDPTASAANARKFVDKFEEAWHYCNGGNVQAILCNEDFVLGLPQAYRYLQLNANFFETTKDMIGRDFTTYRGVPLVDAGLKKDMSTEILPTTETAGDAGADSMSAYFLSLNTDDGLYGIQLNNLQVYDPLNGAEMETKPSKMRRVDWWNGLATFGKYAIVRARNLARRSDWT